MMLILWTVALTASALANRQIQLDAPRERPLLWPLPQDSSFGSGVRHVGNQVEWVIIGHQSPRIERALARYTEHLFFASGCPGLSQDPPLKLELHVSLEDEGEAALGTMDESYSLQVPSDVAKPIEINATSSIGALRALETLAQLIQPTQPIPTFILRDSGPGGCSGRGLKSEFVIRRTDQHQGLSKVLASRIALGYVKALYTRGDYFAYS